MPDREQLIEIAVAVSAVFLMLASLLYIGSQHSTDGGISETGSWMLVGAVTGFVLLLTAIGVVLAYRTNDAEDGSDEPLRAA